MEFLDTIPPETVKKILTTILFILFFTGIRYISIKAINSRAKKIRIRLAWRQIVNYLYFLCILIPIIYIWFNVFESILTLLSLAIAALIFISKEVIQNFYGYLIIFWRGSFEVGDRIEIGSYSGDVLEIGPFYFTLAEIKNWSGGDDHTGRIIKIPNNQIISSPIANYSRALAIIWNELVIEVSHTSNIQKACDLASGIAKKFHYDLTNHDRKDISKHYLDIMFTKETPSVYGKYKDGKYILYIRYLTKFLNRRTSEHKITLELIDIYEKEEDITLVSK